MGGIASKQQLRMSFLRWAVVTVPLVLLLGFASAQIAPAGKANAWYVALAKPAINPPDWLFPIAWTALYILIGLALSMIINARGASMRGAAFAAFAAQLLLNLSWGPTFFGAHRIGLALLIIVAMLVLAIATTVLFARIRVAAAWLMLPYLVWISFAGVLTWRIGQINPDGQTLVPGARTTQILD